MQCTINAIYIHVKNIPAPLNKHCLTNAWSCGARPFNGRIQLHRTSIVCIIGAADHFISDG